MTLIRKKETDGAVRSQALAWHVERLDTELSPHDEAAFKAWLAADPAHEREYRQLDVLCEQLGAFEAAPQVEQAKAYAARYRAEAARANAFNFNRLGDIDAWRALAAASVVLFVAGWFGVNSGFFSLDEGRYTTALGEQLSVTLADGSTIRLNTDSSIDVTYSEHERRVLLRRGQASFDVASDKARPFVVEAGEGIVTAVGTAFDVYNNNQAVTVTLIEGIVEVRPRNAASALPSTTTHPLPSVTDATDSKMTASTSGGRAIAKLRPGDQISIGPSGGLTPIAHVNVARIMAWENGMIDLQNTPLRDAILEVNRYSKTKLALVDEDLADVQVSGIFRVGNTDNFIRALETRFGLQVMRSKGNRILLGSAATG